MALNITGHTELVGLFATPIRHSGSPAMHNEAFGKVGLDLVYLCFEVGLEDLEDAIRGFRAMKLVGANVSMPNKRAVGQYLDALSPAAELCGSVNTIVNKDGFLTGHITDGTGYTESLRDFGLTVEGKKYTVLGAGGAGTAIAIQLALDGAKEISIFNIRDEFYANGAATVEKINSRTNCRAALFDLDDKALLKKEIESSAVLAQATRVGMKPMEGQSVVPDASFFRPGLVVTDAIYSPAETEFLRMAREAGCRTMNGLPMMLFQGAASFKLWTGKEMPIEHMKEFVGIYRNSVR